MVTREATALEPARIVVADRWSILRRGLAGLIQVSHRVVAEVDDLAALGPALDAGPVDLLVIGDFPGVDLSTVVRNVRGGHQQLHVVVLCEAIRPRGLQQLLQAGAGAVLSKQLDDVGLLEGIDRVLEGDRVIDQRFLPLLFGGDEPAGVPQPSVLTRREHEVLHELARGASNREIARVLTVSEATVKTHLGRIYAKLEVDGRHRAVGRAVELGLLG